MGNNGVYPFSTPPTKREIRKYFGNSLIKNFKKQFSSLCWNSQSFAFLSLHTVLGSLPNVRNIKIGIGNGFIDCRVHVFLLQESGTGKGRGYAYTGMVCDKLGLNYKHSGDLTNAALVGSIQSKGKNQKGYNINHGLLDPRYQCAGGGAVDILAASEASQLLETDSTQYYGRKSINNLQKAMNPLGSGDNVITRNTGISNMSIEFNSHASLYLTSYKPRKLFQTVTQTGLLQRMLVIYNPVSFEEKYEIGIKHATMLERDDIDALDLEEVVAPLDYIDKHYSGIDRLKLTAGGRRALKEAVVPYIYKILTDLDTNVLSEAKKFTTRYQSHIYTIAWHHAIMRLSDKVEEQDIAYAKKVVMPIFRTLISFLEDEYRVDKDVAMKSRSEIQMIRDIYKKLSERAAKKNPWILKSTLERNLQKAWNVNRETARMKMNRHISVFKVGIDNNHNKIIKLRNED